MHYAILPHSTLSLTSLDQQDVVYLWCTDTLDKMLSQEVKLFVSHFSCTPSTRQCGEGNFQSCSILHFSETIMSLRIWKWYTSPWRWVAPPLWRPPPWKTQRYQWTLSSCQMQGCQKIVNKIFDDIHEQCSLNTLLNSCKHSSYFSTDFGCKTITNQASKVVDIFF